MPVVLHVAGAGANVMAPDFFDNGLPPVPDFHGGDTNFKSIDYLSIPLPGDADAERVDHRRRVDALSGLADRRHRARRHVGSGLDALARLRARGVPQERAAAAGRWTCARASTCNGRCASRRIRTRTRAGRSRTRATTCACSRPTSRTSKAAAIRSRASSAAWTPRTSAPTRASASTSTTSSTCSVRCSTAAGSRSRLSRARSALARGAQRAAPDRAVRVDAVGRERSFGTGRDRDAFGDAAPHRDVRFGPRRDDVLVVARVGARRARSRDRRAACGARGRARLRRARSRRRRCGSGRRRRRRARSPWRAAVRCRAACRRPRPPRRRSGRAP